MAIASPSSLPVPEEEPGPKRRAASLRSVPSMAHTPDVTAPGSSAAARGTPPETTAWLGKLRYLEAQREIDREHLAEMAKMMANLQAKVDALTRDTCASRPTS